MNNFDVIANAVASIETEMNSIKAENVTLRNRVNELEAMPKQNDVVGYIYILTNPSMRDNLVKIGYADDVQARMKSLYNTSVCDPFECYAIYGIENRLLDKTLHELIVSFDPDLRVNSNREYFDMSPERAYEILYAIAKINGREEHLVLKPFANKEEKKEEAVREVVATYAAHTTETNSIVERFQRKHFANAKAEEKGSRNVYAEGEVPEGFYHNKSKTAYVYVDGNGCWTILGGSHAKMEKAKSFITSDEYLTERASHIKDGKFIDDVCVGVSKPSKSAKYIEHMEINGWDYWYNENDIVINEAYPRGKK